MTHWRVICGDVRERLAELPDGSVQCCVTSPPYWGLRDYGHGGQIGLEPTPDAFVAEMVRVFAEVRRVLTSDGVCWLNLGDSYNAYNGGAGPSSSLSRGAQTEARPQLATGFGLQCKSLKPKDLIGIPWRAALALQADGWYLRSDIIWAKPNPMPESVTDRPTKSHEYIFLLTKSAKYFYNADAIREKAVKTGTVAHLAGGSGKRAGTREGLRRDEWMARKRLQEPGSQALTESEVSSHPLYTKPYTGEATKDYAASGAQNPSDVKRRIVNKILAGELDGRNCRSVWTVPTEPYPDAHFATFPEELPTRCILAGSREGDTVMDPFCGSGTTGAVAVKLQRNFIGIELNPAYVELARKRIGSALPMFAQEVGA